MKRKTSVAKVKVFSYSSWMQYVEICDARSFYLRNILKFNLCTQIWGTKPITLTHIKLSCSTARLDIALPLPRSANASCCLSRRIFPPKMLPPRPSTTRFGTPTPSHRSPWHIPTRHRPPLPVAHGMSSCRRVKRSTRFRGVWMRSPGRYATQRLPPTASGGGSGPSSH
jgi:hypothetical protein